MSLIFPSGIALDTRERTVCERLYPPQPFAFGIQHDLLPRLKTNDSTFNIVQLVGTAHICPGDAVEHDAWGRTRRTRVAGAKHYADHKQRGSLRHHDHT